MIKPASDFIKEAQKICNCLDAVAAKELAGQSNNLIILNHMRPPNQSLNRPSTFLAAY